MSIKPANNTVLVSREGQRQALWDNWVLLNSKANDFTRRQIGYIFDALGQAVGGLIVQDAAQSAKLTDFDEEVYNQCASLMTLYRQMLAAYDESQSQIVSPEARSILDGIYAVLSAQLKQYEDTTQALSDGINPIADEKRVIYEMGVLYAAKQIGLDAGRFTMPALESGEPDALFTLFLEYIKDFCFQSIYTYYKDGLRFCLSGLNDLQQRKAARYYTELMESEAEILNTIVTIQVSALEEAAKKSLPDRSTVHRILNPLLEGYQTFSHAAVQLHDMLNHANPNPEPYQNYEEFEQSLETVIRSAYSGGQVAFALAELQTAFLEALNNETDALHDQLRLMFFKAAYDFQRVFSQALMLADDVIALFEQLRLALPDPDALAVFIPPESTIIKEILTGICETIDIKIESLRENANEFGKTGVDLVGAFIAGKKEVTPEERQSTYEPVRVRWYECMIQVPRPHVSEFFENCLQDDAFTALYDYEKRIADTGDKINKTLLDFKRETLLYEICTYEEILIHSVSRLHGTNLDKVDEAVVVLEDTFKALERLLKKNNIQVIHPEPHDSFNGFEHEVLVAESREGFSKGEIIKALASGYKQNDVVILRANVVAAK